MVLALAILAPGAAHADGFFGSFFNRNSKAKQTANRPVSHRSASVSQPGKIQLTSGEFTSQSGTAEPANPLSRLPVNSTYKEKQRLPSRYGSNGSKDANQKVLSRLLPRNSGQRPSAQRPSVHRTAIQQVAFQQAPSRFSPVQPASPIQRVSREPLLLQQPFTRMAQADDDDDDDDDMMDDEDTMDDADDADDEGDDDTDDDTDDEGDEDEEEDGLTFDRNRSISQIQPTLDYAFQEIDPAELPKDTASGFNQGVYQPRQMPVRNVHWAASDLSHHPLYFEDPALERYGHTHNEWIQPFVSSGRFIGQTVGLPYQMAMDPPWTSRSTLGWYRPGECAPRLKYRIPINGKGTSAEVISIVALLLLIP